MTDIGLLVRTANPVPDGSQAISDDELAAVLLLADQRSTDMDVKEMTTPVTPDRKPDRRWLVAAAAFAGVLVVVALAVWLTRPTDEVSPATSPTTTVDASADTTAATTPTTAAPTTTIAPADEAAANVARSLVAAINDGDDEAVRQIFAQAATVVSSDTADDDDRAREAGRFAAWALLDSTTDLVSCAALSTGPTRCEITRTSPFDVTSLEPQTLVLLIVADSDGAVDLLRIDFGSGSWLALETAVGSWVRDTDPDAFVPMFVDFSDPERTADLWRSLFPTWSAIES